MKLIMLVFLTAVLFTFGCNDGTENTPSAASSLVGKWKLQKIIFEADLFKVETPLPGSYQVLLTISEDGTYTYAENGQEKKQTWLFKDDSKTLVIKNEDQTESQFDVSLEEDGTGWSYMAYQIDLTKSPLPAGDNDIVDFATLIGLANGKNLPEAKLLKVFFVMKKN
jgi:hypothetical protein